MTYLPAAAAPDSFRCAATGVALRDADEAEVALLAMAARECGVAVGTGRVDAGGAGRSDSDGQGFGSPECVRVATTNGQVSGFYRLTRSNDSHRGDAELDYLVVYERWRRQGLGRLLVRDMRHAADRFGLGAVRIVAHPSSTTFFNRTDAVRWGTQCPSAAVPWSCPVFTLSGFANADRQLAS